MSISHTCSPGYLFAAALQGREVDLLDDQAVTRPLAVWQWHHTTDADRFVLAECQGATLDVGCGPGRMTAALGATGARALGIDVVPEAIRQTAERGAEAILGDVFDDVPGAGTWETVLLADGNIGIGGDPLRLLRRIGDLLVSRGRVVADVSPPGRFGSVRTHRLSGDGLVSEPFPWAVVGADQIEELASRAGFGLIRLDQVDGRWFAVLERLQ